MQTLLACTRLIQIGLKLLLNLAWASSSSSATALFFGFPLSEISLSTLEAEYSALSKAMRMMIPLRALLLEIVIALELNYSLPATIRCTVFEDNNGAYLLATNQKITSHTKYYAVK